MAETIEIILIAGHGGSDKGAKCATINGHDWWESELTILVRDLLAYYLNISKNEHKDVSYTVITDNDTLTLQGVVSWLKNTYKAKNKRLILDIHFDAFNKKATGTTTFIPDNHTLLEKNIGEKIASTSSAIMGIPNRGCRVESRSNRGKLGIMRPEGENILWEVCFGDNPSDLQAFFNKQNTLIVEVSKQILQFVKNM